MNGESSNFISANIPRKVVGLVFPGKLHILTLCHIINHKSLRKFCAAIKMSCAGKLLNTTFNRWPKF